MITRILLPLDISPNSESALAFAVQFARATGGEVVGLGITDAPSITKPEFVPAGGTEFLKAKHRRLLKEAFERISAMLLAFQLRCTTEGVAHSVRERYGSPANEIVQESHRHDILIMPQHGNYKYITQRTPCDTLRTALSECSRPVVVVPTEEIPSGPIVLLNDNSPVAGRAIQTYLLLALPRDQRITVLSVNRDAFRARDICEETRDYFHSHKIEIQTEAIEARNVGQTIVDYIGNTRPSMVVMGAFGNTGLKSTLFGSTTDKILKKSICPVFVHH